MNKCIQGTIVVCCLMVPFISTLAQTPTPIQPTAAQKAAARVKAIAEAEAAKAAAAKAKADAELNKANDALKKAADEAAKAAVADASKTADKAAREKKAQELADSLKPAEKELFVKRFLASTKGQAALEGTTNYAGIPYHVFLSSGAVFESPYTINYDSEANTAVLKKNGSSTRPFLEFGYYNRFVIRTDVPDPKASYVKPRMGIATGEVKKEKSGDMWVEKLDRYGNVMTDGVRGEGAIQWVNPLVRFPDIDTRLGFVFNSGDSVGTNKSFSASTIAGSGDFYSQSSVGLPILRYTQPNSEWVNTHQVTLEFAGGITTDKEFLAVHPNAFVGFGYQTAFAPFGLQHERGFFFGRLGYGWADSPVLLQSTNLGVKVKRNLPEFELEGSVSLGAYLSFPLSKTIYLNLGANAYLTDNPAQWNITAGATIPLANFGKVFKSILGSDEENKPDNGGGD